MFGRATWTSKMCCFGTSKEHSLHRDTYWKAKFLVAPALNGSKGKRGQKRGCFVKRPIDRRFAVILLVRFFEMWTS